MSAAKILVLSVACFLLAISLASKPPTGCGEEIPFAEPAEEANAHVPATPSAKWALMICGIPGDIEHHALFSETVESLHQSLTKRLGFSANKVRIQFGAEPTADDGPAVSSANGRATRTDLIAQVKDLRGRIQPADSLWVFVLGHAHFDGRKSYLNLPGAVEAEWDMHADEFAQLFADVPAREQIFFIMTPASGFFIRPLSAEHRIVVTATEADREVNETFFPVALAEVLAEPPQKDEFDIDDDGQLSLFDLYIHVTRKVARRYSEEMLLSTEHAQLDDNGDGRGTELQLDYLTEEEGGRVVEGVEPPRIRPNSDGFLAKKTNLPLRDVVPESGELSQ